MIPLPYDGERPWLPVDGLHEPIDVLEELPCQPAFADPALACDRDEPDPPFACGGVVEVLQQAELVVAADERRFERCRSSSAAALSDHAQGAPRRDGRRLALEELLAGLLEGDRARGGVHGGLADEHGAGRRGGLQAARGVDHVAGDHPLADGPDRDGGLPGEDAGPGLDGRPQPANAVHQLQGGPNGPLGVVLVARRGAPHGHDGVADELLDRSPTLDTFNFLERYF